MGAAGLPLRGRELRIEAAYESGLWETVRQQVPLRHPSQLYEAAGEGILLALLLWSIHLWHRRTRSDGAAHPAERGHPPDGLFVAVFLAGYGTARFVVELFRQPDAQFRGPDDPIGTVLGPFTMGQVLSAAMILTGVLVLALRRGQQTTDVRRRPFT